MKNAAKILTHIKHQPQFAKLTHYACIQKIRELLPPHLQKLVLYGYIRNNVMFFALAHPGAKQEFDIILDSIKAPLKAYPPKACSGITIADLKAFVSHKPPMRFSKTRPVELQYAERAKGAFANPAAEGKLHDLIEDIRTIIHDRTD